jgi:hypothetical protein
MEIFSAKPPPNEMPTSCTEDAIRRCNELTISEQSAGILLRQNDAVAHCDVLGTYKMETVIVPIDAVMNVDTIHMNALVLNPTNNVVGTVEQIDIANGQTFALIGEKMVGRLFPPNPLGADVPRTGEWNWNPWPSTVPGPSTIHSLRRLRRAVPNLRH